MKITRTIRRQGTADCEVRFAITKEQMQIVREHYGQPEGVPLHFGGRCEVYAQGNGWYAAWCTNDVVDGALRAIIQIEAALRLFAERQARSNVLTLAQPATQIIPIKMTALRRLYAIPVPQRHHRGPYVASSY